jgi:hypothetical protein
MVEKDQLAFSEKTIESIGKLIKTLNDRAKQKIDLANRFLYVAFIVVAIGISIFILANKLTDSTNVTNTFNKLRENQATIDSLHNYNFKISMDAEAAMRSVSLARDIFRSYENSLPISLRNVFVFKINGMDGVQNLKLADSLLVSIQNQKEISRDWNNKSIERIFHFTDEVLKDVKTYDSSIINFEFYNALSTRIGAIVIIFFIVQVLIRIYRYNTRLGNYYKARADALELYLQDDSLPLDKLIEVLSPDSLDIGVSKTPVDQVVEIFKHAQSQTKKND